MSFGVIVVKVSKNRNAVTFRVKTEAVLSFPTSETARPNDTASHLKIIESLKFWLLEKFGVFCFLSWRNGL